MPKTTEAEDLLTSIEQQERFVQQQETIVEAKKGELKEAKEEYEQAVYDLRKLIRTRDEENPLLDEVDE
jgi:hypothetical protein